MEICVVNLFNEIGELSARNKLSLILIRFNYDYVREWQTMYMSLAHQAMKFVALL